MPTEPYRTSIEIAAPPASVFPFLTEAQAILRWMGDYAVLDARPGGAFTLDINGIPVRGRYLTLDPPRRVVISWGHAGSDLLPPGSSTVEITLEPIAAGTRLHLEHRDLPAAEARLHAVGWPHFLARLRLVSTGRDPDADGSLATPPPLVARDGHA